VNCVPLRLQNLRDGGVQGVDIEGCVLVSLAHDPYSPFPFMIRDGEPLDGFGMVPPRSLRDGIGIFQVRRELVERQAVVPELLPGLPPGSDGGVYRPVLPLVSTLPRSNR